jgi:Lrp/AsnC family transcriptional regulator, leucine-responsive regulatory protein
MECDPEEHFVELGHGLIPPWVSRIQLLDPLLGLAMRSQREDFVVVVRRSLSAHLGVAYPTMAPKATVGACHDLPLANLPVQTQDCCVGPIALDDVDRRLLELLQRDCSKPLFELGQKVSLSTSAVQRRLRRFERAHLIERQAAVLNTAALGEYVFAWVLITLERESSEQHAKLRRRLSESPAVQQCYGLAGQHDYAVLLVARGMSELRTLIDDLFMDAPNIKRFVTMPVLDMVKAGLEIPVR